MRINKLLSTYNNLNNDHITYIIKLLINYNIDKSWYEFFLKHSYKLSKLLKKLDDLNKEQTIYPPHNMIFTVFEQNINDIKIVLLGQDPYIKEGQAMGLSFSVPKNVQIPPSLYNIFKEIKQQFPERNYVFTHGDLTEWKLRGIFLLNSSLTVESGKSNSHQSKWTWFSDEVIKYIDSKRDNVVFLLFGRNAIDKHIFITNKKNYIITGVHPSPLSAYNGFFGSEIFKKVEDKLNGIFNWSN
jgi:uracil-DNA glycosylase